MIKLKLAITYRSTHDLSHEADAGNLRTPQLEALEAVLVRRAYSELLLEIVRVDDSGQSLLGVDGAVLGLQTVESSLGLGELALTDQMPG